MRGPILIHYHNCSLGGASSVILDRIEMLRGQGVATHCVFTRDAGGRPAFEAAGAASVSIMTGDAASGIIRLAAQVGATHIILMWNFHLLRPLRDAGHKVIVEFHGSWLPALTAIREAGPEQHHFVVPSEWTADLLRSNDVAPLERIVVYPNRVRKAPDGAGAALADDTTDLRLIWVGRIAEEHKNWRDGLAVAAYVARVLREQGHAPQIDIILSNLKELGELKPFLDYAANLGLIDLRLFYNVPPDLFDALFARWGERRSVLLSTSKAETFGLAAAQALASGIPAVLSKGGAIETVFRAAADAEVCRLYDRGDWHLAAQMCLDFLQGEPLGNEPFDAARHAFEADWQAGAERFLHLLA